MKVGIVVDLPPAGEVLVPAAHAKAVLQALVDKLAEIQNATSLYPSFRYPGETSEVLKGHYALANLEGQFEG